MSAPVSGVSRRLQQCVVHLQGKDFEGALVNLFPAIDKTAKKRRPKDGVGARIKAFLVEEEALISAIATGNVFKNIRVEGISITDALYEFGRNPIAHEGELDPRLQFNDAGGLQIGKDKWNLPAGYIVGLCAAVIVAPENAYEKVDDSLVFTLFGTPHKVNDLWGKKEMVQEQIASRFKNPKLFEETGA